MAPCEESCQADQDADLGESLIERRLISDKKSHRETDEACEKADEGVDYHGLRK